MIIIKVKRLRSVWEHISIMFLKFFLFFLFKIKKIIFSDCFIVLMLKIILKK